MIRLLDLYDNTTQALLSRFLCTPFAQTVHSGNAVWLLTRLRRLPNGLTTATLCSFPKGRPVIEFPMTTFDFPEGGVEPASTPAPAAPAGG